MPDRPYADTLREALRVLEGDRDEERGDPVPVLETAAKLYDSWTGEAFDAARVAQVLICVKMARFERGLEYNPDNMVDLCGYASILNHLEGEDEAWAQEVVAEFERGAEPLPRIYCSWCEKEIEVGDSQIIVRNQPLHKECYRGAPTCGRCGIDLLSEDEIHNVNGLLLCEKCFCGTNQSEQQT